MSLTARVRNLGDYAFSIAVTGMFDNSEIPFSPSSVTVDAGAVYPFSGSFTMPAKKVRVTVYSWYWTGSEWYQDDEAHADIALAEAPESQFASIEIINYERR